jgi:ribosomal protein S12 methylthiotransferase accessory factor
VRPAAEVRGFAHAGGHARRPPASNEILPVACEDRRAMSHLLKAHIRGCHRLVAPAQTLARLRPLLAGMGITRVADITGLDRIGIPVFVACRPNARALAVSQGKGLDADAARVSAIMESIESFHAERMQLPLQLASWRELSARAPVVDVARLMPAVEAAFHPDLPLLWVCGDDVLGGGPRWVPHQVVHTQYTRTLAREPGCFLASSTGLASGNHRLEAQSHALCEVVERDAKARFDACPPDEQERRRVDLASIDDVDCRDALQRFRRAGISVAVWDITGPVALPAFECLIVDREDDGSLAQVPASGFGCHAARGIALLRALTEAAQSRLTLISGSRDDITQAQVLHISDPGNVRAMRERAEVPGARDFRAAPDHVHASFDEDLALQLGLLRRAGIEQCVLLDLNLPDTPPGIHVVRVVVPGLLQLQRH